MLCDQCHEREASVTVRQILNGVRSERQLCSVCAKEDGLGHQGSILDSLMSSGLLGQTLFGGLSAVQPSLGGATAILPYCPTCGQSYAEFRKSGLLGCGDCYKHFRPQLRTVLKRVQRGIRHLGRQPAGNWQSASPLPDDDQHRVTAAAEPAAAKQPEDRLTRLKRLQQEAVSREDYEEAARIRDLIRAEEGGNA